MKEVDGTAEKITITLDEFLRPVLRAQIQSERSSPKPPVVNILVAHLKSKGPARVSFASPKPQILEDYPNIAKSALSHVRRVLEPGALRAMPDEIMVVEEKEELSSIIVMGEAPDTRPNDTNGVT